MSTHLGSTHCDAAGPDGFKKCERTSVRVCVGRVFGGCTQKLTFHVHRQNGSDSRTPWECSFALHKFSYAILTHSRNRREGARERATNSHAIWLNKYVRPSVRTFRTRVSSCRRRRHSRGIIADVRGARARAPPLPCMRRARTNAMQIHLIEKHVGFFVLVLCVLWTNAMQNTAPKKTKNRFQSHIIFVHICFAHISQAHTRASIPARTLTR